MSTLVVSGARFVGSALVNAAGQVALSYANAAISQVFDNRQIEGPRMGEFQFLTSRDGAPMALTYGRVRLAGQVIWASRLRETKRETQAGGKGGGPTTTEYSYRISFAIGLCEGVIQSLDRLWVNGAPLATKGLTMRVHHGTEDQDPDPIISAIEGGSVPGFRGTAYVVIEDFPLDDYGARLPQFNAEVTRLPPAQGDTPRLETLVGGVHLLPSSGEFAYATDIVEDASNPGAANAVNMNNLSGEADIIRALDQLADALPACKNVSLVISWFGTDLRAAACQILPGVESGTRSLSDGARWSVNGIARGDAYVVSKDDNGRPNYGGTPSDGSIVAAIKALKSRGYAVTIYPFILMDIDEGNGLPDPYGRAEQPKFPWRGRITCHPAAGQAATVDQTAAAAAQVDDFFGQCSASDFGVQDGAVTYSGPDAFSFRRFILHYAKLAEVAGGVERFIIGSEMVGLTTVRSGRDVFPAVERLTTLAADVRGILREDTQISYAADWSEYFGYQPQDGTGDVHFHLDELWASAAIDAVGIDAYFPLSDWREGADHFDAALADSPHDIAYLQSQIEGGEGFDYYYADNSARENQSRSFIKDPAYAKPWVFAYKNIRRWWGEDHITRIDGVETTASPWVPRSKPFWLVEIGCPAVDKGANQPNVFFDPKSAESKLPYHSSGARDDLIQRRYIEAILRYFTGVYNPVSDLYDGRMIDTAATHIWCWDARPFPDFPARSTVWSDGANWEKGHWLTGRVGLVSVADVVYDLVSRTGLRGVDTSKITGLIDGYRIDRPMSVRAALGPLATVYGFDVAEGAYGLSFVPQNGAGVIALQAADIVDAKITLTQPDPEGYLRDVRLSFVDNAHDHQIGNVSARARDAETVRILDLSVPIVMDESFARRAAERLLARALTLGGTLDFTLSPKRLDITVGDVVTLPNVTGLWQVESLDGPMNTAQISARAYDGDDYRPRNSGATPAVTSDPVWMPKPVVVTADLPMLDDTPRNGPLMGASASPFNTAALSIDGQGSASVASAVKVGALLDPLLRRAVGLWDKSSRIRVYLPDLQISAVDDADVLSGVNRFAVETDTGWEIFAARDAVLVADGTYELSYMLRGLSGSDCDMMDIVPSGARVVWLSQGLTDVVVDNALIGGETTARAIMAGRSSDPLTTPYHARHLRPLSPVHAKLVADGTQTHLSWIRRTRIGGDSWAGLDVPLGETLALYAVVVTDLNGIETRFETETTTLNLPMARGTIARLTIAQGSLAYGFGPKLSLSL